MRTLEKLHLKCWMNTGLGVFLAVWVNKLLSSSAVQTLAPSDVSTTGMAALPRHRKPFHTRHTNTHARVRGCVCVCFLWRASGCMSAMKPSPSFSKASPFTRTCCRDSPGGDAAEWHVEERGRKVCATCGKGKPTRSLKTCILLLTRTGNGTLS